MTQFPRLRPALARATAPLPQGTLAVGAGLLVNGITAYGFLVISGRALGVERYASLSALWALIFLLGPGLFLPIEQEVGRAVSARRARGIGGGPVVSRAAVAAAALAGLLAALIFGLSGPLQTHLFDGQVLLVAALAIGLTGYSAHHLARGTFSGNGRFAPYGLLIGTEGVLRLAACVALAAVGVGTAGPFGLALGLAPVAAVLLVVPGRRGLLRSGPEAPWSELSGAIGYLLAGSLLAQTLMNAGPLAVKLLAPAGEAAAAGRFLAALVIARIPVFLFQAVQAALLPALSHLAASGRHTDFRTGLRRLLLVVGAIGILATGAAFMVGPEVVRLLFGPEFDLERASLTYLAGASAAYMIALALAQALIALSGHARAALGWMTGVLIFVAVVGVQSGLLLRVERGFLAGAVGAAVAMGLLLLRRLPAPGAPGDRLLEAVQEVPMEP